MHQVVVAFQANARAGNRAQKGRAEIAKSTKKPWNQKGTGRARAGRASSPLWRGGGKIFPSTPEENFQPQAEPQDVSRRHGGNSFRARSPGSPSSIVDSIAVEAPKTKLFAQKIKGMGFDSVLVVTDSLDENTYLASRNLPNVLVLEVTKLIRSRSSASRKC